MNNFLELFIKGIPIGISNTLPGVSGGTMALVLKIYEKLINGIKEINLKTLIPLFFGGILGVFVSSRLLVNLLEKYPNLITAFLFGLILASSKVTAAEIDKYDVKKFFLILSGILMAVIFSISVQSEVEVNKVFLFQFFIGGFLGSMAMILPGISGGTILVMLGIYRPVINAISNFDIMIIFIFGIGLVLGLLTISRVLSYFLDNYRFSMMALLTGLILGSLYNVIPPQINLGVTFSFISGFLVIEILRRYEKYS